jgi:hypothetical protein
MKTCNPSGSIRNWLDIQATIKITHKPNPPPQTRKKLPQMMKIKKTRTRVNKKEKRPSRKVMKT